MRVPIPASSSSPRVHASQSPLQAPPVSMRRDKKAEPLRVPPQLQTCARRLKLAPLCAFPHKGQKSAESIHLGLAVRFWQTGNFANTESTNTENRRCLFCCCHVNGEDDTCASSTGPLQVPPTHPSGGLRTDHRLREDGGCVAQRCLPGPWKSVQAEWWPEREE